MCIYIYTYHIVYKYDNTCGRFTEIFQRGLCGPHGLFETSSRKRRRQRSLTFSTTSFPDKRHRRKRRRQNSGLRQGGRKMQKKVLRCYFFPCWKERILLSDPVFELGNPVCCVSSEPSRNHAKCAFFCGNEARSLERKQRGDAQATWIWSETHDLHSFAKFCRCALWSVKWWIGDVQLGELVSQNLFARPKLPHNIFRFMNS